MEDMLHKMLESSMSAQGNPRGSVLVSGLFLFGLQSKIQKRSLMRLFRKHCLKLAWPVSVNSCQGQCLHLGQEIHFRQIIFICHQENRMK